jgi:hypothetical protein
MVLIVLSIAGFGKDMNWKNESKTATSEEKVDNPLASSDSKKYKNIYKHTMTFTESLVLISTHIIMNLAIPPWLKLLLTSKTRMVRRAAIELGVWI